MTTPRGSASEIAIQEAQGGMNGESHDALGSELGVRVFWNPSGSRLSESDEFMRSVIAELQGCTSAGSG